MLLYNTQLKKLILPEYGRNIQNMVDYCLTIEDRDERNHCAHTIVNTMIIMFPELRNEADFEHKLWDHLAIMSDFKLDIDYPYEMLQEEALETVMEQCELWTDNEDGQFEFAGMNDESSEIENDDPKPVKVKVHVKKTNNM